MPSSRKREALEELLPEVCAIARQASAKILEIYATDFSTAQKQDRSPLTEADLAAHEVITRELARLTPSVPIVSEEAATLPFSERSTWARYWLVDPLDGTKEFIKKNGEFTVNIALIEKHRSVLGVVNVPVADTTYFAAEQLGAFRKLPSGETLPLRTRRTDSRKIVVSGSRSHAGDSMQAFINRLPGEVELVSRGSSLKFCLVAEGSSDIYPRFGPTSEWDTAAAQCVVEQAGGLVLGLDFEPLLYNAKADILNPHFVVLGDPSFAWQKLLDG